MIPNKPAPSARNLALDLLHMAGEEAIPGEVLVQAGAFLGFTRNTMRVALTRLQQKGLTEKTPTGHYRLTARARPMRTLIDSWREGEERHIPWDHTWLMCHVPARSSRTARNHSLRALAFLGFREGLERLWVRPNNLARRFHPTRALLRELGLEPQASLFSTADAEPQATSRWQTELWPIQALQETYRRLRERLEESMQRLPDLPREQALAEAFQLGSEAVYRLVKDPVLPGQIMPPEQRQALHDTMLAYDDMGRRLWLESLPSLPV